ncbi:hypothetical protein D3C81_921730 [compost metagenome]
MGFHEELVRLSDELLTIKILECGKADINKMNYDQVQVKWGEKLYFDLELFRGDIFFNVFLDSKEDAIYSEKFYALCVENRDNRVEYLWEKKTGYTRYKFKFESELTTTNFFIKLRSM